MNIEQLRALAERLEKETGQDEHGGIRVAIADALDLWAEYDHDFCLLPEWDCSMDAAMALVARLLPDSTGNQLSWRQRDVGKPWWCGYWASMVPPGERSGGRVEAYATTPALAILRALVAALIARAEATQ